MSDVLLERLSEEEHNALVTVVTAPSEFRLAKILAAALKRECERAAYLEEESSGRKEWEHTLQTQLATVTEALKELAVQAAELADMYGYGADAGELFNAALERAQELTREPDFD